MIGFVWTHNIDSIHLVDPIGQALVLIGVDPVTTIEYIRILILEYCPILGDGEKNIAVVDRFGKV